MADQFLQVVERVFIVEQPAPLDLLVLWDSTIGELYLYVVVDRVQSWLRSDDWYETFRGGTAQLLEYMTCNLDRMNNLLRGGDDEGSSCTVNEGAGFRRDGMFHGKS